MKWYTLSTITLFLLYLSGCASLSVNYDYNQQTDFSQYKTYNWLAVPQNMEVNELNRKRFVSAVETNLADKNMTKDTTAPDLLIATHFGKETKVEITNWGYSYAPGSLYGGYGYRHDPYTYGAPYVTSRNISTYEYDVGELILDFIDAKTRQLIWRATARDIISPASTPEKQTEKINKAVDEILQNYPPQQKAQ